MSITNLKHFFYNFFKITSLTFILYAPIRFEFGAQLDEYFDKICSIYIHKTNFLDIIVILFLIISLIRYMEITYIFNRRK